MNNPTKKTILLLMIFAPLMVWGQQPYYDDVDLFLTGEDLYDELQTKISQFNTSYTYGEYRDDLLITDENPVNGSEVLLFYGFNDTDADCTTDRTRSDNLFGGAVCDYNREHVFPRSVANPPMGDANNSSMGIVADPHNLRPTDVQRNGERGSRRFTTGSGNSIAIGGDLWYPGDEWRGDVARAMMYMYVRYGDRCLPQLVGTGATQGGTDMLQLFLQWNVEDPVSDFEEQRNPLFENTYGNRNPFIDNPVLATIIWGGPEAEDIWNLLSLEDNAINSLKIYPNPATDNVTITASNTINNIEIYSILGKKMMSLEPSNAQLSQTINLSSFATGVYLVKIDNQFRKLVLK